MCPNDGRADCDSLGTVQAGLRESDAWPAQPQDAYGLEKIVSEECCRWYGHDNPEIQVLAAPP